MLTDSSDSPPRSNPAPAILDVEASGFGSHSYPIEIGYVLPNGSAYCTLVRPAEHWTHWDDAAEQMHGITRAALLRHGHDVADVAQTLNQALRGLTLYSDAWGHDYPWLATLYEAAQRAPSFKLESLRSLLSDSEQRDWKATMQQVSNELGEQRHRASNDARLLQATLMRLRGMARDA